VPVITASGVFAASAGAYSRPGHAAPRASTSQAAPAGPAEIEQALLDEMNRVRARNGRRPLASIGTLKRPARSHSRYLLRQGILTHDGPGGAPFWQRLVDAGYPEDRYMAENLAEVPGCDVGIARETVRLWMNSPGHRANLLNRRYRFAGPGVASAGDCSDTILTADFGS
jgi:uncharacterized protein YkwD